LNKFLLEKTKHYKREDVNVVIGKNEREKTNHRRINANRKIVFANISLQRRGAKLQKLGFTGTSFRKDHIV
jgi:hypothetical protein